MYPWAYGNWRYGYPECYGWGGYGMGYFFYNPFGWNFYGGCGSPGLGMGYGSMGYGSFGDASGGYGGGGGYGGYYNQKPSGALRLKVKPDNARVYVDGYFAGTVDSFDGTFQKLIMERGKHKIEISAAGYTPLIFDVDIREYETTTYEGRLEPIK
jgi:hypothetical protein